MFRMIVLVLVTLLSCVAPVKKNGWDRYQSVLFKDIINSISDYLNFDMPNTVRIYTPPNAYRGVFKYLEENEKLSEQELWIIQEKYSSEIDHETMKKMYVNKSLLESNGIKAWFCFQESVFQPLLQLSKGNELEVYYQFIGSTNAHSEPHLLFAVTQWIE